jgi:microcystin-dependent protein
MSNLSKSLGCGSSSSEIFIGDYKKSVKNSNHGGWLLCNGVAISREVYSGLFSEIGISFGAGNGSTTFNLPDFSGKVFGSVNGSHPLGQSTGSETSILSTANLPPHTHSIDHDHATFSSGQGGSHSHTYDQRTYGQKAPYGNEERTVWEFDSTEQRVTSTAPDHNHSIDIPNYIGTSGSAGSSSPFSILQPTLYGGNIFIYSGV